MKYGYWLTLCLLLCANSLAFDHRLECKVVGISDGDTFTCLFERSQIKVRLLHIDAPESAQPYGNKAKQALAKWIFKRNVTLHAGGYDRYRRLLAVAYNDRGDNINLKLVEQGMAWAYHQTEPPYEKAQRQAQAAKIGLWQDKNAVNPAQWRKNSRADAQQAVVFPPFFANAAQPDIDCSVKRSCRQIGSYPLALRYFHRCGWKELDGNNDGIPCNKLYRQQRK